MGVETFALVALSVLSADQKIRQAEKEAKAVVRQGELEAKNKAKEVARKASAAKVSFLNSGLTLEGTPETAIGGIFDTGLEDINAIRDFRNTQAKNIISSARTNALLSLGKAGLGAAGGGSDFFKHIDAGFTGLSNDFSPNGFALGFQASQAFDEFGGGFAPGEFKG